MTHSRIAAGLPTAHIRRGKQPFARTQATPLSPSPPRAQACALVERLVGRLRRLDEVLPRYQRTASALYELLRVRALEEVVPAVRQLLGQA